MVYWEETWDVEVYIYHQAIKAVTTEGVEQKTWAANHGKSNIQNHSSW